jgi:hypothetical protein
MIDYGLLTKYDDDGNPSITIVQTTPPPTAQTTIQQLPVEFNHKNVRGVAISAQTQRIFTVNIYPQLIKYYFSFIIGW